MKPLKHRTLSNERIQALLFTALTLFLLPSFIRGSERVTDFILLVSGALALDLVFKGIQYRKIVCCVSASVSAAVLTILTPGVPFLYKLGALALALLIKYPTKGFIRLNPAVFAAVILSFLKPGASFQGMGVLLFLFIPFMMMRPAAALFTLITGLGGLFLLDQPDQGLLITTAFASLVLLTDPVSVFPGIRGAVVFSFILPLSLFITGDVLWGILIINLISSLLWKKFPHYTGRRYLRIRKVFKDITPAPVKERKRYMFTGGTSDVLRLIKKSGINGRGGGAFPLWKKIEAFRESSADERVLIINGAECDPGLIHDKYILKYFEKEVALAAGVLYKSFPFQRTLLAAKRGASLSGVEVVKLPGVYPIGAERLLIKEVLKRDLPENKNPAEEGILVVNVQTLYSLYRMLEGEKSHERFITLGNLDTCEARVITVKSGTPLKEILEKEGVKESRIFKGGGLMKGAPVEEGETLSDSVNSLWYGKPAYYKNSPQCSSCGFCLIHCPAGIHVKGIWNGEENRAEECMECGACSWVCPAGRSLSEKVRLVKMEQLS